MNTERRTQIANLLVSDAIWSAYALADLQPEMAPDCRWFVHENGNGRGVALLYRGLTPPVLFMHGDPAALAVALDRAELPETVYLSIQEAHEPVIARRYRCVERRRMWRMVLHETAFTAKAQQDSAVHNGSDGLQPSAASDSAWRLRRLTAADAVRVEKLFAHGGPFTPDAFVPRQIESGVFYGVEDAAGKLIAVGGTHVVDFSTRIAAVGNMYTRPDLRGRGAGRSVLRAIIATLKASGVETIVLNVDQRNDAARRLYEQFGFVVHCPFIEGIATSFV
jgi:ribosomal protein S18 acetylase RimI-like enzyme